MTSIEDVPCPARTCGAQVGQPCQTSTGTTRTEPHGLRWLNIFTGPLVRCPNGPCKMCHWTAWVPDLTEGGERG